MTKFRIKFVGGKWDVIEPNGEVCWHFMTLAEACNWIREIVGPGAK